MGLPWKLDSRIAKGVADETKHTIVYKIKVDLAGEK